MNELEKTLKNIEKCVVEIKEIVQDSTPKVNAKYISIKTFAKLIDRKEGAARAHIRSKEFRHCIRQDYPGAKFEINWPEYVRTKETQCVPYPQKKYV